jgi:hypothetical protein
MDIVMADAGSEDPAYGFFLVALNVPDIMSP